MKENRKYERSDVKFQCTLTAGDVTIDCEVQDLSAGGAKVKVGGKYERGTVVSLALGNFGSFSADIMWAEKSIVGLNFHRSPEEMAEAIMAIAMHA